MCGKKLKSNFVADFGCSAQQNAGGFCKNTGKNAKRPAFLRGRIFSKQQPILHLIKLIAVHGYIFFKSLYILCDKGRFFTGHGLA